MTLIDDPRNAQTVPATVRWHNVQSVWASPRLAPNLNRGLSRVMFKLQQPNQCPRPVAADRRPITEPTGGTMTTNDRSQPHAFSEQRATGTAVR